MPTPPKGPRLGGSPAHERLMLSNLARSLFEHGRITTTHAKAKRLRPYAERLITFAKRGDLHARRQVLSTIPDKDVVAHLFVDIGPRYAQRPGGYTRITKIGPRKGDNAPMAIIELVEALTVGQEAVGEAERARGTRFARDDRAAALAGGGAAASTVDEKFDDNVDDADDVRDEYDDTSDDAVDEVDTDVEVDEDVTAAGPYGLGSAEPNDDGTAPAGFPVKVEAGTMTYHTPGSPGYDDADAEVYFDSTERAEAAGFAPVETGDPE